MCDSVNWGSLTSLSKKQNLFALDSFFREGLGDAQSILGQELLPCLHRTALVLFKPEAIGGRRLAQTMRILMLRGFQPVAAEPVWFDGPTVHSLWRYQFRRATPDKIRLYTRWAAMVPAMLVAYVDTKQTPGIPASIRLKMMKGPAVVERRNPEDLRTLLKSQNPIINFIHSADEPADILREIPILLGADCRDNYIRALAAADTTNGRVAVARLSKCLYRRVPRHDLDPVAAGRRLIDLGRSESLTRGVAVVETVLRGETVLSLRILEQTFHPILSRLDPLDVFAFGAGFIARDVPGEKGELDEDCISGWLVDLVTERA